MIFVQLRLIFLSIILVGIQSPFLLEETLFASEKRVLDESSDTEGKLPAKVTEISLPRFLLGGAIGTTFGFGVGHGIQ